jgi:hypothetical protein
MYQQKKQGQKFLQRFRQKTNLKLIVAGSCIVVISAILLIYFNLTMVEEMKAGSNANAIQVDRPVDLNVAQIKIDSAAARMTGTNYIIAKPLDENNSAN